MRTRALLDRPRAPKALPMYKKFPNQWSMQTKVWTPQGTLIEGKGPTTDEVGTLLLALISNPKPKPEELKMIRAFTKRLSPSIAKAADEDRKKLAKKG